MYVPVPLSFITGFFCHNGLNYWASECFALAVLERQGGSAVAV